MKDGRVYVCHTFYHVYVACLKELHIRRKQEAQTAGAATLVLSTMSNHFGDLFSRARASGLFQEVVRFDEKEAGFFSELAPLKRDTGSLLYNLWNRIRFCRKLAALEAPYV
ncbi:MAG: lipooligosaccharide sialyltransferase, partial [Lachnospiraceae bacterium]|nr:lipooligosaccharide sialyltransferase [Lachnospiraceae bacterium]